MIVTIKEEQENNADLTILNTLLHSKKVLLEKLQERNLKINMLESELQGSF